MGGLITNGIKSSVSAESSPFILNLAAYIQLLIKSGTLYLKSISPESNIGIAFSDIQESWPNQWPVETAMGDTFMSVIYDASKVPSDTLYFPGVETALGPDGFPDAPCGIGVQADREAYFVVTDNDPDYGNTFASNNGAGPLDIRIDIWVLNYSNTFGNDGFIFIQKMNLM